MIYLNKIVLSVLLTISIPAYKMGTPVEFIKCLILDDCKNEHQEEA